MVITSSPLPKKEAGRLNTLVNFQPKFTLLNGQFSADENIGILNHKIQDVFRREARYASIYGDDEEQDPFDRLGLDGIDESTDPIQAVAGARMRAALESEIEELPPNLKAVFRMQALEGMTTVEVCEQLSISEANCWVRLHRARKHLVARMRDHLT
jgi:RNA polymerase sigma-70 factor (ECF subfamily)